jgi:hypothetical protein
MKSAKLKTAAFCILHSALCLPALAVDGTFSIGQQRSADVAQQPPRDQFTIAELIQLSRRLDRPQQQQNQNQSNGRRGLFRKRG